MENTNRTITNCNYEFLLKHLNKIEQELTVVYESNKNAISKPISAYFILKKIKYNTNSLSLLSKEKMTVTSMNLLYRAIFSDLLTLLFLLHLSSNEFIYCIQRLDISHVKSMHKVLHMRYQIGEILFGSTKKDLSEQDYFDRYYRYFKKYISSKKGEPWVIIKASSLENTTTKLKFNGTLDEMYKYICECDDNENLKALSNLYLYYKYLSQTEHFSFVGRHFPFVGKNKVDWINELNASIYSGIIEVGNLLKIELKYKSNG